MIIFKMEEIIQIRWGESGEKLETHCQFVADHYNTLNVAIGPTFLEKITCIHVAEMDLVIDVIE